jgi:hypothetical protein
LQPLNVSGLEVLANGVLGVGSYRNQLANRVRLPIWVATASWAAMVMRLRNSLAILLEAQGDTPIQPRFTWPVP